METVHVIVITEAEWKVMLNRQQEMLQLLRLLSEKVTVAGKVVPYITAMEFMQAVHIGRTKFDQLVAASKVRTIKKDRKIYVPVEEVERYFKVG